MKTYKTFYFTSLAEQHFGKTMAQIVATLDNYGPLKYSDILKYSEFDNIKLLEIAITLGIKHQIIGYKITKLYNEEKKLIKKQKLIYLNHVALFGREYIPELLYTQSNFIHIFEYALKNGVFGIINLVTEKQKEKQIESQINELLDKSLIQVVQTQQSEEKQEIIKKNTRNKTEKKLQKLIHQQEKQQDQKTDPISHISLLQLNWNGILDYVRNTTIKLQLTKIYGLTNFTDLGVYYQLQKELKKNLEQKWLEDKFTLKHSRIINVLRLKNCPLDERQICDLALLDYADSNQILQELLMEQFIKTEISKVGEKEKQVYLFDQKLMDEQMQLYFYKGMINCRDKKLYLGILNQMHLMQFEYKS